MSFIFYIEKDRIGNFNKPNLCFKKGKNKLKDKVN